MYTKPAQNSKMAYFLFRHFGVIYEYDKQLNVYTQPLSNSYLDHFFHGFQRKRLCGGVDEISPMNATVNIVLHARYVCLQAAEPSVDDRLQFRRHLHVVEAGSKVMHGRLENRRRVRVDVDAVDIVWPVECS